MAFFISDILSALGPDISVRESVGQRADDGSDMKKDFFIIYLEQGISEIDELQCHADYGKGYDIPELCDTFFLY